MRRDIMAKGESKELAKTEPARMMTPFEEMEKRFEEFFRRPLSLFESSLLPRMRMGGMAELMPSVDILEEGDNVVVKAELPGMKKEDIDVKLTDNTVIISGEKKKEEKEEKKDYYRLERSYGAFTRSFSLPSEVDFDKAKASLKDGVLEIRVPKTERAKQKQKKITIE
jgi:HSP20 family protein